MNRTEWSAKTGLPPHLFEASREELAATYFNERGRLGTLLKERDQLAKDGVDEPALLHDALAFCDTMMKRQAQYVASLKQEWERKQ